jgi:hypothetical protein
MGHCVNTVESNGLRMSISKRIDGIIMEARIFARIIADRV